MKTTHKTRRLICLILAITLVVSIFAGLTLAVFAAPALPAANSKVRHIVCTSLSSDAQSYYTGNYTYAQLSTLSGVDNAEDCWATTQNNPLYTSLQTLMSSTHANQTTYTGTSAGSLAYYWVKTDAQSNSSTYYCFYSDLLYGSSGFPSDMQREHIWPKSNASFYQTNGGSDLHHLRPSVGSLNNSKSNKTFGEMEHTSTNTKYVVSGDESTVYYSGTFFEPKDDIKGDVARILLYVYCRWGQPNLYTDVASSKLPSYDSDDSQNNGTRAIDSRAILLKWMKNDPVDTWEMERNDLVQDVQGNRNVFIDYPEFAWLMFGLTPPSDMTTPSGMAASSGTSYTVTATSSNTSYGTVSVSGNVITASPAAGYYAAGYNVTSGTATVTQNGNTFTVSPSSNCTVQIVFAKAQSYTVTYMANNSTYSTATAYGGDSITLPSSATNVSGWTFVGWTDNAGYADGTSEPVNFYQKGSTYTVSGNVTLYAVYTQISGSGGESTATITFADLGLENGVQYSDPFDGGNFTVTFSGGGNDGKYYTTGTGIRVYGGGTMTVATTSGTITSIKITCASGYVIVAGTSDVGTLTVDGTVGTWTGDASSVSFTRASGTGHWRIQSVEATVSGGGTTTYSINPTNAQHTHELAYNAAVAATCSAEGHSAYYYCAGCGKYFSDAQGNTEITQASTVIAATGNHTYGEWTQADAANHQKVCSVCGNVETEAHSFTDTVTAPTVTKQGYTTHTCTVCGYSYADNYTDAIGFVAEDGIVYQRTDAIATGDKIVIANTYNNVDRAVSFQSSGNALVADEVSVNGDLLTPVNTTAVFTVQSIGGDATVYYLVTEDGRYLTASSGVALTLTDTPDATYSKWMPAADGSKLALKVYTKNLALSYYNGTFRNGVYAEGSEDFQMALYKRTEAAAYTVTYTVPTGVTAPAAQTVQQGSSLNLPTAGAPEGYTFLGWVTTDYDNVTAQPTGILTGSYTPAASTTLKALYSYSDGSGSSTMETTETITFGDLSLENGVQYSDPFDGGDFTVTFSGGGNNGKYYTTGAGIRVYGGGTMTVAAKSGTITGIKITCASGYVIVAGTSDVGTLTVDGAVGTWTGDASSVSFTRASGSGHWRIQKVEATVSTSAAGTTYYTTVIGEAHSHTPDQEAYHYDENGHWRVCSDCGETYDSAAHSLTETVVKEATYTETGVKQYTCDCGYSYVETIPMLTYSDSGSGSYELLTDLSNLKTGDKVVVYNPANTKAMTSTLTSSYYLSGADVTISGTTLTPADATVVWTVTKNADNSYTFTQDDKTLYGYASGTYVDLGVTASNEEITYLDKWVIEELTSTYGNTYSLYCDGLVRTTSTTTYSPVYLEYYNCFVAYGNNNLAGTADQEPYAMQFYVLQQPKAQVKGVNLVLEGNINTNAYLAIPDATIDEGVTAVVTTTNTAGETVEVSNAVLSTADKGANGLYKFTAKMPAKDMNTKVTIQLMKDGQPMSFLNCVGEQVNTFEYCVQDYLQQVINAAPGTYDEALVNLCKAMSDYGYAAQQHFEYHTDEFPVIGENTTAYGWYFASAIAEVSADAANDATLTDDVGTGVKFAGASLILESETTIRLYFKITGTGNFTATVDGEDGKALTRYGTTNYWYIDIQNIAAKELCKAHTVTVTDGTNSAGISNFSAYSYVNKVLGNDKDSEYLKTLVKALKYYGDLAVKYFA